MPVKKNWNSINIWQRYGHICDVANLSTCGILSQTLKPSCTKKPQDTVAALGFSWTAICAVSEKHQLQSPPWVGGGHLEADALKLRYLLTAHSRRLICSRARHQPLYRHHCGLQIVQTSIWSITRCGEFFSSTFTAGKSKVWTRCDNVSLMHGNAWTRTLTTTQSNSGIDIFTLVAVKGGHFEQIMCKSNSIFICL